MSLVHYIGDYNGYLRHAADFHGTDVEQLRLILEDPDRYGDTQLRAGDQRYSISFLANGEACFETNYQWKRQREMEHW